MRNDHGKRCQLQQQWLVEGNDLRTRQRRGGRTALKGFDFQAAHAVNLISQLLVFERGLVQVRYEGAQDIDLMFGDGRQVFMQLKDSPQDKYSITSLRKILHGFMKDAIDACGNPADLNRLSQLKLEFVLVVTGTISGIDPLRILNGTSTASTSQKVADKFGYDRNPIAKADVPRVAQYVLEHIDVRLVPTASAQRDQTLAAMGRLAVFGVASAGIESTINNIRHLLTPPREYAAADVYACMNGLSDTHPVTGRNGIVVLPGLNRQPDLALAQREFRETGRTSWASIYHQLDAARDITSSLQNSIDHSGDSAMLVLLLGPSGSGKSAVIRRLAWNMHVSGTALVFEVIDSEKISESTWDDALRIASMAAKPAVFVVDDLGNHPGILEHLARNPSASVKVLASNQQPCVPASFSLPVHQQSMPFISTQELTQLANGLNRKPPSDAEASRLITLFDGRDIFSISPALQGMSRHSLAQDILSRTARLNSAFSTLFLGICACGVYDQSVPRSVLLSAHPVPSDWATAIQEHLLFEVGEDRVRAVHAALADTILTEARMEPALQKVIFLPLIDAQSASERRFGLGLLQDIVRSGHSRLIVGVTSLQPFAEAVLQCGDYLDLDRCANIFESLIQAGATRLKATRERLLQAKQADRVRTGYDAILFMRENDQPSAIFEVLSGLFSNHETSHGRTAFMRWITDQGRAHPQWHMQTIEQQFEWVQAHGFPSPETLSLINCMTQGNPDLTDENRIRLVGIVGTILEKGVFIDNRSWKVIRAVVGRIIEAVHTRLRDDMLLEAALNALEANVDLRRLSGTADILRGLKKAGRGTRSASTRMRILRMLRECLNDAEPHALIQVARAILGLLSPHQREFVSAWGKRFNASTQHDAIVIARQFAQALDAGPLIQVRQPVATA